MGYDVYHTATNRIFYNLVPVCVVYRAWSTYKADFGSACSASSAVIQMNINNLVANVQKIMDVFCEEHSTCMFKSATEIATQIGIEVKISIGYQTPKHYDGTVDEGYTRSAVGMDYSSCDDSVVPMDVSSYSFLWGQVCV